MDKNILLFTIKSKTLKISRLLKLLCILPIILISCKQKESAEIVIDNQALQKENEKLATRIKILKQELETQKSKLKDLQQELATDNYSKYVKTCLSLNCRYDSEPDEVKLISRSEKEISRHILKKFQVQKVKGVKEEIKKLTKDPYLKNASLGIAVFSMKNGKLLFGHNPRKLLVPASNMKLVTTAAAFNLLKPESTFRTSLKYSGKIENGVLKGNIYIEGGGDPTLGAERPGIDDHLKTAKKWTNAITKLGIKKIEGSIIGDSSFYNDYPTAPKLEWEDLGEAYGAPVSALNFHENYAVATLNVPAKTDRYLSVFKITPTVPGIKLFCDIRTVKSFKPTWIQVYGAHNSYIRRIDGRIAAKGMNRIKVSFSIPHIPLYTAQFLKQKLEKNGIEVSGKSSYISPDSKQLQKTDKTLFHTIKSPPLQNIIHWTNYRSLNLYADSLVKIMGKRLGKNGSLKEGSRVIMEYWKKRGIPENQLMMIDGSGLSRINLVSPSALASILYKIRKSKYFKTFYDSLLVAGKSGSVWMLGDHKETKNNMRIKQGYIYKVRSFSGYVKTRQDEMLGFSIIVNNYLYGSIKMKTVLYPFLWSLSELD
ncbi:MAG: D-alanyl-D-alanine carboxypeptidase/D-alanyl-D-alanine endopeptidase [Myxococcota bacterium]